MLKLYFNGNEYFVLVPIKKKVCSHDIDPKIVALDPTVLLKSYVIVDNLFMI